jgi:hypothetical protein
MFSFGGVLPNFLYNFGGSQAFEALMRRDDTTLEQVLDYEGIQEEVRAHTPSLNNL